MKIEEITIVGFRGFNNRCTIALHPDLTLVYGPNSCGKTSITEAVEWLLYSATSKVAKGDSKDEYKGSYRNCHTDDSQTSFVKIDFTAGYAYKEFKAELVGQEGINRYVDGNSVDKWPIETNSANIAKPFVMQHALKYLLHVSPEERYKGFAQLLGLDELYDLQNDFVSFCTKPQSSMPARVSTIYKQISSLVSRLSARATLKDIYDIYNKGAKSKFDLHKTVWNECLRRVPEGSDDNAVLPHLLRIRDDSVQKVFSGTIALAPYTQIELAANTADSEYFIKFATEDLISQYCALLALSTRADVLRLASFYEVGLEFLKQKPKACPFCGQKLDDNLIQHIYGEHKGLNEQSSNSNKLLSQKTTIINSLNELKDRLTACQQRHVSRTSAFLKIEKLLNELEKILTPKYEAHFNSVHDAITKLGTAQKELIEVYSNVETSLKVIMESINQSTEDAVFIKQLGENLVTYSKEILLLSQVVSNLVAPMSDANQILKHELDLAAGTEDISILIDLVENVQNINKVLDIELIYGNLRELRKTVDQYVASEMLNAITEELSDDVMNWYGQIRTVGDPDVHFSGFDIDRTKKGDLKSRRVQIKASSYGKELTSAVSSLSESKLNVLGLCMSISANLKPTCPFGFIFIDDPIQSLDEEHGTQFIEVVRKLVDSGKQVILLSHNKKWMERVRAGCRSLNGIYYEITGYTMDGPVVSEHPWCAWRQRLDEADTLRKDNTANSVRLQQAEQEIRIIICDLTAMIYLKNKGIRKNASTLNAASVRKLLLECGISLGLVDRISETFETTDDSHHAPEDYSVQRHRIKKYHDWAIELAAHLN